MDNKKLIQLTFLTPTMKRTGSEIVLFNLISRISDNFRFRLLSVYKGDLLSYINKRYSTVFVHQKRPENILSKIGFKIKETFFVPRLLNALKNSVWYINTIVLWDYLEYAEKNKIKVILHIHEMEQIFALLSEEQLQRAVNYPDVVIANSNYTMQLVKDYGRTKPIELCYPAIDTKIITASSKIKAFYRSKLNIPINSFVWAMCGTLDDNKNPLLFIDIAVELIKIKPYSVFIWVGGTDDCSYADEIKNISINKGMANKIIWIDKVGEEYQNYFQCADGFVLTSKKESFSIVTLEALLLGLPVVTHDCGGVKEILRADIGTIINDKENVSQFVQSMCTYMENSEYNKFKGIERGREFDIEIWSKKWNTILNNYTQ